MTKNVTDKGSVQHETESVDCVCGHNGKHHREEEDTGAARECTKCSCKQFSNVHMALEAAASNMKAAILQRVREKAAHYSQCSESASNPTSQVSMDVSAETLRRLATELEAIQLKDEDQNEQS